MTVCQCCLISVVKLAVCIYFSICYRCFFFVMALYLCIILPDTGTSTLNCFVTQVLTQHLHTVVSGKSATSNEQQIWNITTQSLSESNNRCVSLLRQPFLLRITFRHSHYFFFGGGRGTLCCLDYIKISDKTHKTYVQNVHAQIYTNCVCKS